MSAGAARSVLVTGAAGYVGAQLVAALAEDPRGITTIVATDVREVAAERRICGVHYEVFDISKPGLAELLTRWEVDTVVHLAAIVTPGGEDTVELEYQVDVVGTLNVLEACLAAGVRQFVYTSSGAAYGYWPDNPEWIHEDDPLRGNDDFAYSRHKRMVEEMLAEWRRDHPELGQMILRPGVVIGATVANQITAIFERPAVVGIQGAPIPFVFIWDQDLVQVLLRGVHDRATGAYNLAGDGAVPLAELARRVGKPYVALPAWLLRGALAILHPLGIAPYGPEQVAFLEYRPVLSNEKLKNELGYIPRKTSSEAFDFWVATRPAS